MLFLWQVPRFVGFCTKHDGRMSSIANREKKLTLRRKAGGNESKSYSSSLEVGNFMTGHQAYRRILGIASRSPMRLGGTGEALLELRKVWNKLRLRRALDCRAERSCCGLRT
jgi:hypothetical protein